MSNRWIVPYSDGQIIQKIIKLRKKFPNLSGTVNIGISQFNITDIENDVSKKVSSIDGNAIVYFNLIYGSRSISYNTTHGQPNNFSQISVSNSSTTQEKDEVDFFLQFFKEFPSKVVENPLVDQNSIAGEFMKIQSALAGAVDQFAELQNSFQAKNQELREKHEIIVDNLKDELKNEKVKFEEEIANQRNEIASARKQLDDRSNTHARRSIRTEIKDSIVSTLSESSLSVDIEKKRIFLRVAYIIAIFVLVGFVAISAYSLNSAIGINSLSAIWLTGIKLSISSISTIGMILLYLKWEGQWIAQQANFERVLSSTKVDIDRASWVAESLLEWNRESPDREIPKELLESFTRRLFDWDAKVEDHQSAQDSLASAILGSAAKIQIGSNGTNIELDHRGIKKLDKQS